MRSLLLAVLLGAAPVGAQPLASALSAPEPMAAGDGGISDPVLLAVMSTMAALGAGGGAFSAVLGVGTVAFLLPGLVPGGPLEDTGVVLIGIVGGVIGSGAMMFTLCRDQVILRETGLARDAWVRGLLGAVAGSAIGLGAALLVGPAEEAQQWLLVPLAQGVGTGLVVTLSR